MDKCHIQGEGTQKETKRTKSGGINTLKELEGKKTNNNRDSKG